MTHTPRRRSLALLAAATTLLVACNRSEPDSAHSSAQTDSAPTAPVNRTPNTDPWLFEGIPNFEDLVAMRSGDWLIVLGSTAQSGPAPAPTIMAAADPRLASIQQQAWNTGRVPFVINSSDAPKLAPGLRVVVLGPYDKPTAQAQLTALQSMFSDAYIKAGW